MAAVVAPLPSLFNASPREIPSDKFVLESQMSTAPASPGARPASPIGNDVSDLSGSLQKDLISALIATPIVFREAEDANPVIYPTPNMVLLDDSKLVENPSIPLLASRKDPLTPAPRLPTSQDSNNHFVQASSSSTTPSAHPQSLYTLEIPNTWPPKSRDIGVGLNNVGNTCFLNSVLQCLLHTPALIYIVIKHAPTKECLVGAGAFCMICKFRDLVFKTTMSSSAGYSYTPVSVLQSLKKIAKSLRHGRQEDAHEFLRYIIDAFQRSALHDTDPSLPHAVKETTWVHKIFGGRLRSRVICRSCGHLSDTFDSLLDLSIDVPKRSSIREALDAFVAIDVLAGADKYKCEKCEKPVVAEKQFTIHEAPQVLTIHLKRFTPLGRKMTHLVRYDEHLSLQKYMSAGQFGPRYTLYAVISHFGSGPNSGHYLAHVKGKNGRWFAMNDDSVDRCSRTPLDMKNAYVLFYVKDSGQSLEAAISIPALAAPAEILPRKGPQNQGQKKRKAMFEDDEEDLGTKASLASPLNTPLATTPPSSPVFKKPKLQGHKVPEVPQDREVARLAARIAAATSGKSNTLPSSAILALSEYTNDSSDAETNDVGLENTSQTPKASSWSSTSTLTNNAPVPSDDKSETDPRASESFEEPLPPDTVDSTSGPIDASIPQSQFSRHPNNRKRYLHSDENSSHFHHQSNRSVKLMKRHDRNDHKRQHKRTPFSRDALRSNLHEDRSTADRRPSMASRMKKRKILI